MEAIRAWEGGRFILRKKSRSPGRNRPPGAACGEHIDDAGGSVRRTERRAHICQSRRSRWIIESLLVAMCSATAIAQLHPTPSESARLSQFAIPGVVSPVRTSPFYGQEDHVTDPSGLRRPVSQSQVLS